MKLSHEPSSTLDLRRSNVSDHFCRCFSLVAMQLTSVCQTERILRAIRPHWCWTNLAGINPSRYVLPEGDRSRCAIWNWRHVTCVQAAPCLNPNKRYISNIDAELNAAAFATIYLNLMSAKLQAGLGIPNGPLYKTSLAPT